MNWNANGSSHSYTFTYDGVNRMLNATHATGAYTEKVTAYDKNGNIKALQRYGNGLIDNLTYTYNGNQLTKVEDATGNVAGFRNGASTTNEYNYDNNGNLTKDSNKNISNIAYNVLNLPSTVTFSDGSTIVYSYSADGTKLRTVHVINGTTTQKDYCSNVVYENGIQKMLLTEEGYVDLTTSTPTYYYYLKDHQGNNRVIINKDGGVVETNHYYPFGGVFASTGNVQPYKYNGKELDTKKGLNWYDYGARHYDATLGRWFVVDPLAEKYYAWSSYNYCLNNPIGNIDPDGKSVWTKILKGAGKVGRKISQKGFSALKDKGTYVEAFADIIEDTKTVFDENASIGDRVVAGLSLASELLPVSANDAKDVGRLLGIHGNSKMSEKAQHAYDIIEKQADGTKKRVKTGVSSGRIRSDDKSYRAEQQVRKWNKEAGYEKYESEITYKVPEGPGARDKILKYEQDRANKLRKAKELDENRHKRP